MKKLKSNILLVIILVLIILSVFFSIKNNFDNKNKNKNEDVLLLLEWVPNTNHTGIFVALKKGFYNEEGINVSIKIAKEDDVIPLVASGKANFGISFQDKMAQALVNEIPIKAVATINQHNTSGIISLKNEGINSFKNLENKTYATWGNEIEQSILKKVMEKENGDFEKVNLYYSTITDALTAIQTNVDAVWAFEGWEYTVSKLLNLETNFIRFADNLPELDYYTPVIISNENYLNNFSEISKKFLKATKKGYEYAIKNPEESAKILHKNSPEYDLNLIIESQKFLSKQYKLNEEKWGYIDPNRWNLFFDWLYKQKIINKDISNKGFSNEYLD